MEKTVKKDSTREPEKEVKKSAPSETEKDLFSIEEIEIEEMAIDGICGVY